MQDVGLDLSAFKGSSRADMILALEDARVDGGEGEPRTEEDGSVYGPDSYFAHAMAKDD